MSDIPKMVIVANMAASMSIGRLSAQIAHAAVLALLQIGTWEDNFFRIEAPYDLQYWMKESFTKVVVKAWGEDALLALERQAKAANIKTALMVEDDGQITALALGPAPMSTLAPLTKDLILM